MESQFVVRQNPSLLHLGEVEENSLVFRSTSDSTGASMASVNEANQISNSDSMADQDPSMPELRATPKKRVKRHALTDVDFAIQIANREAEEDALSLREPCATPTKLVKRHSLTDVAMDMDMADREAPEDALSMRELRATPTKLVKPHALMDVAVHMDVASQGTPEDALRSPDQMPNTEACDDNKYSNMVLYRKLYRSLSKGEADAFIAEKADTLPQLKSPQGNTVLHVAVSFGHINMSAQIIKLCPQLLLCQNKEGNAALHIAAITGRSDVVRTLIPLAAETNIPSGDQGSSGTTTDIENGGGTISVSSMWWLKNNEGNTALHEALINGHLPVAESLIMENPMGSFCANKENKSCLYLAAEAGLFEIVNLIHQETLKLESSRDHPLNMVVVEGKSPWQAAVLGRNKGVLEIISNMEFNMKLKDERGRTPLHYAASTGYLEGVRFLLDKFPNDSYQQDSSSGTFPIHSASSKGHVHIVKELLEHCPESMELQNRLSQNILHVAAKCGKDNVVSYLLKKGEFQMLINQRDENGNTPLHLATLHKCPNVVNILTWDRRINLNISNSQGNTALDVAESTKETMASFNGRLTWIALKSAGAKPTDQTMHALQRNKELKEGGVSLTKKKKTKGGVKSEEDAGLDQTFKESIKERVNTLLVVTTLIATVTFAAGFTMPGGFNSIDHPGHLGMATLLRKEMLQVFVICDTVAMYSSILVAITLIWAQLGDLNLVLTALRLALPLLGIALTMFSVTFMAGVYVVTSNLHWLSNFVLITGIVFLFTAMTVYTPLFFPTTSTCIVLRYINYYPLRLAALAFRNHNKYLEEA